MAFGNGGKMGLALSYLTAGFRNVKMAKPELIAEAFDKIQAWSDSANSRITSLEEVAAPVIPPSPAVDASGIISYA